MKKYLIGTLIVVGLLSVAAPAKALTSAEAEAIITALSLDAGKAAAIRALVTPVSGTTMTSTSVSFSRNLTVGNTGADVTALQTWLEARGFLTMPAGVAKGYFGTLTKNAVAAYQASVGLPSTGFFGPMTMAKIGSSTTTTTTTTTGTGACPAGMTCVPTGTTTTTTTTGSVSLSGTDGTISDATQLSQYSSEEVGDGESDVKVLGLEVEASKEGDILLRSLKVSFDSTGNSGSDKLGDYVDGVSVWMGSTKIGSADVQDFNEDTNGKYSKTISLKSGTVIRADQKEKIYVAVDAVRNLDSGDISGDSWTVDIDNIRYEDGSGVTSTDVDTGDINALNVPINFVNFSTAANTELKISTDSSNPNADIVVIDDTDTTDDVVLLVGKIEAKGTSDIKIDELPITLTTVGGANVTAVTGSLKLQLGDEEYTETVNISSALTGTVTFDNLDFTIAAGKTVKFTVLADINDIDAGTLDEGDTLKASITTTNRDYIDAENEEGDQLSDTSEKTGTATGEAQEFRTNGIALTLVGSPSTSVAAGTGSNDDQGTFTIRFKVKAIGDTVYVSSLADSTLTGNTSGKTSVHVDRAGTATVGGVSVAITNLTDTDLTSTGNYMIEEGDEETFEMTTTVQLPTAGQAGLFRAALGGVRWGTSDIYPLPNSYISNLDAFKTSYIGLN